MANFLPSDLEQIIVSLAKARASLDPPVFLTIRQEKNLKRKYSFSQTRNLASELSQMAASEFGSERGIGWLAFTLSAADKDGLREFLGKRVGHSHASH